MSDTAPRTAKLVWSRRRRRVGTKMNPLRRDQTEPIFIFEISMLKPAISLKPPGQLS